MVVSRLGRWIAFAATGALLLTGCGSDNPTGISMDAAGTSDVSGTLSGVGASSQQAVITSWQTGFQLMAPKANMQYSPDGSGAGRKALIAGAADYAGSDAHLKTEEFEDTKAVCGPDGAINIPVYVSPIAVAFNVPGIESLNLDAATIAKIFKGEISSWNDPVIAAQNESVQLPDTRITVVHRSDDSGTTENFTEYLETAAGDAWGKEADGNWPADYAAEANKGTSGVVSATVATEGAITYADASAIGNLGTVNVQVGDGSYVELSPETAAKTVEISEKIGGMHTLDMSLNINRTPGEGGAYPIVLVSYHIICSTYEDQETVDLVKEFESYVVSEKGQQDAAASAGSAPLTPSLREQAQAAVDAVTTR